jgi:hypothetical protein
MKKHVLILFLFCIACHSKTTDNVQIEVDKNSKSIKVTGVPPEAIHGIQRDTLSTLTWLNLFPVCSMPVDTDMRDFQPPLTGKYSIVHDDITFTPDVPFKAGQTYFARYYRYDERISSMDLVMHKRTPGKAKYTELIFKY